MSSLSTFNDQHPILTTSSDVGDITARFLKRHKLNYFQHLRVFDDGSMNLLLNRPDWISFCFDYMQKNKLPAVYSHITDTQQLSDQSYWFLWENNIPRNVLELTKDFDIYNGITFVERFADHYTMTAVAAPQSNTNVVNFYLNNIDNMASYFKEFQSNQQALIQYTDQHKLQLIPEHQDQNLGKMLLNKNPRARYAIAYNNVKSYITQREFDCLAGLVKGLSYKEMAYGLDISPRTVETYLNRIKDRFKLYNRRQLFSLFQAVHLCP